MRLKMMDNNIDQTSSSVVKALDRKQKSYLVTGVRFRPGTKNFFCFFLFLFLFSSPLRSPHSYSRLYFVSPSFLFLQRQSIFLKFDLSPHNILSQPSTANRLAFVSDDRQRSSARKRAPNNEFLLQHSSKAAAQ